MMDYAEKTPIFAVCGYDDFDNYDTTHWLFLYKGCAMGVATSMWPSRERALMRWTGQNTRRAATT